MTDTTDEKKIEGTIELSTSSVEGILRAVGEYNGTTVGDVVFLGSDGMPVSVTGVRLVTTQDAWAVRAVREQEGGENLAWSLERYRARSAMAALSIVETGEG